MPAIEELPLLTADPAALEPSCVAWRSATGGTWFVAQRATGRLLRLTGAAAGYPDLVATVGPMLAAAPWPPVLDRPPVLGDAGSGVGVVAGDGALATALRDRLGGYPGGPPVVVQPFFRPGALADALERTGTALPVFGLPHTLVVGPLVRRGACVCVRCVYGRLYACSAHPAAFAAFCAAAEDPGAGRGPFGTEPLDVLDAGPGRAFADSVAGLVAQLAQAARRDPGTGAAYTLDWASGTWRRRVVLPLPGGTGDHGWTAG